jgi:hypothetical protein
VSVSPIAQRNTTKDVTHIPKILPNEWILGISHMTPERC